MSTTTYLLCTTKKVQMLQSQLKFKNEQHQANPNIPINTSTMPNNYLILTLIQCHIF